MTSRTASLSFLHLPEHLRKKMSSPDPLFSPSVAKGADGLHCMFSPQDAPFEQNDGFESINESHLLTTDSLLSPEPPPKHANVESRCFDSLLSPQNPVRREQIESPYSIVSQGTIDSFKTAASIEMLSLPFIERCNSEETLEQILRHLKEDGNYPSLLWSTEQRLATIRQPTNHPVQSCSFIRLYAQNESSMMKANPLKLEREHETSLQMSLSTDYDDDTTSPVNQIYISKHNAPDAILAKKSHDEVKQLEEMIRKLESRYARECKLNESTIRTLNNAIEATEQKSQRLQNEVTAIQNENVELYKLVKDKTEEVNKVKTNLSGSEKLKHELLSQIHQLKTQLAEVESKALDRTYPRKIHALEQLLQSAQKNIREVQQERDSMLKGIFHMQGKEAPSKLSKEDRQQIISSFRKDSNSLKLALDKALVSLSHAEQNAISEKHRAKMIKQKSERQLKEATKRITELENEVATFIQKMERMERSLKECEERRLRDKNEWETRENRYKEKVRKLNKEPNGVSMSLFKLVRDESESRKLEIQKLRMKSAELESTLLQWKSQPLATTSQMRPEEVIATVVSQRVDQGNVDTVRSQNLSSSKRTIQQPNAQNGLAPNRSTLSSIPKTAFKNLVIQTKSPKKMKLPESPVSGNTPMPPNQPAREPIDLVFSGTQVSPHGSRKIKVVTIPIRDKLGSDSRTRAQRSAQVASTMEEEERENGPVSVDWQVALKADTTKHLVSVRSEKENHGNRVNFSFPTPDEKKRQTGHDLRLKKAREAGGLKGLRQLLEKKRSPRSMCLLDE